MKKIVSLAFVLLSVLVFVSALSLTPYADNASIKNGLYEEDGKTYYYVDGEKQSGWFTLDGIRYYASSTTKAVISTDAIISTKQYFWVDGAGLTLADGFYTNEGTHTYATLDTSNGAATRISVSASGTICFDDGYLVYGWRHSDGSSVSVIDGVYEQYSTAPQNLYYFLSSTYTMVTSGKYTLGGWSREFNADHTVKALDGLQNRYGDIYYYVKGTKQSGWQTIGGNSYYFFKDTGKAASMWNIIGGKVYYFYAGTSATPNVLKKSGSIGGISYTYASDGAITTTGFFNPEFANKNSNNTSAYIQKKNASTMYFEDGVRAEGWKKIGNDNYYFYKGTGLMVTESRTIGGEWFDFTPEGICTTKAEPEKEPLGEAYSTASGKVKLDWKFTNQSTPSIAGDIVLSITENSAAGRYTIYFGNNDGIIRDLASLAVVRPSTAGTEYAVCSFGASNALPDGVTTICAVNLAGKIAGYLEIPEEKVITKDKVKVTFAAISDVHVFNNEPYGGTYDYINGDEDLKRAIGYINDVGVDFTAITGDLILSFMSDKNQINAELIKCTDILKTATSPVYVVKGNHDKRVEESTWKQLTGCDLDYYIDEAGYRFIFLSLKTVNNVDSNDAAPYGSEKVEWLRNAVNGAKDKKICLFMHYPFYNLSGLVPGNRYGFTSGSAEEQEIMNIVRSHGSVAVFSGHTHYDFESENTYDTMSVASIDGLHTYTVHLPSVAYPRDAGYTIVTEKSEGYIVEVLDDGILLKGIDFTTGKYVPSATYFLDLKPLPNSIENDNIKLTEGESEQIKIEGTYKSVKYTSLDKSIASVSTSGKITAVSAGTTTVTVEIDGFVYKVNVKVVEAIPAMSGSGTKASPFILTIPEHFVYIQEEFRSGNTFSGVYFKMGKDIDLTNCASYKPSTTSTGGTFAGVFDGAGHVLKTKMTKSAEDFAVPYFWNVTGTIVNTIFDTDMGGCAKTSYVIARTMNGGTLANCIIRGTVYASNANTSIVCGTSSGTKISNVFIDVTVTGTKPSSSDSGISMKGSGKVENVYYIPNGCAAHFKETSVSSISGLASKMNGNLSQAATTSGVSASSLCSWKESSGVLTLIAK